MAKSTKADSHVKLITSTANKIVPINDYRILCLLTNPVSNVVYKDKMVTKDKKRS